MSCVCSICGYRRDITNDFKQWPLIMTETADIYPVTTNGKPDIDKISGFICARCLNNANSMRLHIKCILAGIKISMHAYERFYQRYPSDNLSERAIKSSIIKLYLNAKEVKFREKYQTERIINNNFKAAKYFYNNGFIFVVSEEKPPTIITIESAKNKKEGVDFWFI